MKLLGIDTSGKVCGAGLLDEDRLLCEMNIVGEKNHSVHIMPMIDEALERTGTKLADVDAFAVVTGPGSFTGVRIGVAAAKGLALAAGKPCIAVDALEALAAGADRNDAVLCPMFDARAGQVYAAAFRAGLPPVRLLEDTAAPIEAFLDAAEPLGDKFLFMGDGAAAVRKKIEARLGDRAMFAAPQHDLVRIGSALAVAMAHVRRDAACMMDGTQLLPLYLRAPQAERERAAKEAAAKAAGEGDRG